MVRHRFASALLVVLVISLILACGCSSPGPAGSQPPAATMTIQTRRPTIAEPETTQPAVTATTILPVTTVVTPVWTPVAVSQAGSAIQIDGDIVGLKSATANAIDEIQFSVVKSPRADPVSFQIPDTQIVFTKNGGQYTVGYRIISGDLNKDSILDQGEIFMIDVPLAPQYMIYPNEAFTMAIQSPPSTPVTVTTPGLPAFTGDQIVIARAT
ncbi:MAG TPA: hypothetical protein VEI51_02245 [Methanomicrobiales archaeon]|nr:hypothetical protein [Methanomicrobiales archaeon]